MSTDDDPDHRALPLLAVVSYPFDLSFGTVSCPYSLPDHRLTAHHVYREPDRPPPTVP
jgi:hypothetical protein